MACHALLQGIFPTQGSNPGLLHLLRWQMGSQGDRELTGNGSHGEKHCRDQIVELPGAVRMCVLSTGNMFP